MRKKMSKFPETGPLLPPVLPKAGSFYVYYLGTDSTAWDKKEAAKVLIIFKREGAL